MLNKLLIASVITASTIGAAAANPAPYVGASVGVITNTSSNVNSGINNAASIPGNFRGVPFNLFAGYGGVISQSFYLAGEVFGTVATAEISDKNNLKTNYGYGVSIIPGLMLSDHTLAYARAGVLRTQFSSPNAMSTGGQLGVGLQTSVTQNVDLRGEYDYVSYRSVNHLSSPTSDAFNLGLVYKFD